LATSRIVVMKIVHGAEGSFLPEAWKMKNAERTCDARTDGRDYFTHVDARLVDT
jgi:hypothetical protein